MNTPLMMIERIYLKDFSFESPMALTLIGQPWQPTLELNLQSKSQKVDGDRYEVTLHLQATVKAAESIAFLIDLQQAGVFQLSPELTEAQLHETLNCACPAVLFPYAQALIAETCARGALPPIYVAPVDFVQLYQQYLAQKAQ